MSAAQPDARTLTEENRQALGQLAALLENLPPAAYQQLSAPHATQSVGKHVRHILEHYQTLLNHFNANATMDYEQRVRETALETDPQAALARLQDLDNGLATIADLPANTALTLHYPLDIPGGQDTTALPSSLGRELAFLTSHSIHHMALISLLCAHQNIALPEHFGVHPSTLRYWQTQQAS